jgi:hypothetical protein
MNAPKAEKEASEKKVFLNQKITHVKQFLLNLHHFYVKSVRVSSILLNQTENIILIGATNGAKYIRAKPSHSGCSRVCNSTKSPFAKSGFSGFIKSKTAISS